MLLEQEIASVMFFALHFADDPKPYYYDVPEDFHFPAMFFPQPEIDTGGETMQTYAMRYYWYINVMDTTTEAAYERAFKVLSALKQMRNLVPLINPDGSKDKGGLRLNDPSLKIIDSGVVRLVLSWTSRRPYDRDEVQKMVHWEVEGWQHPDIYNTVDVATAMQSVIKNYASNYPKQEYARRTP